MHTFRRLLPAAVVGLGLVLSGCGGSPESERRIAVAPVANGVGFEPTEITVDKDDNVRLAVGNATAALHGFSIEGYGIRREVEPNDTMDLRFKSSKPGTFRIFCQLHEAHQIATLVVQ